jgi:hypothetical protein
MVADINFPKNLPKIMRTARVKRAARQNKENQKQPFQKFLNQNESGPQEGQNGQDADTNKSTSGPVPTTDENAAVPIAGPADEFESDSQGKRIDVHA